MVFRLPVEVVVKDLFDFLGYRHSRTSLFFLKMSDISYSIRFNLQNIGAMRLLVATSEVCLCEVLGQVWLPEKCTKSQIFKCQKISDISESKVSGYPVFIKS